MNLLIFWKVLLPVTEKQDFCVIYSYNGALDELAGTNVTFFIIFVFSLNTPVASSLLCPIKSLVGSIYKAFW